MLKLPPMFQYSSGKPDPNTKELYQGLADMTSIFWEFHKARVSNGEIPLVIPTNAQFNLEDLFRSDGRNLVYGFGNLLSSTIHSSWEGLLTINNLGLDEGTSEPPENGQLPRWMLPFIDPYITKLAIRTDEKFRKRALERDGLQIEEDGYAFSEIMRSGVKTGADIGTTVKSIMGPDFNPLQLMWLSKVNLYSLRGIARDLGVQTFTDRLEHNPKRPINQRYTLLDDNQVGLNTQMLRDMGLGKALGCVASIPPSPETREFISARVPGYNGRPVMPDFARYVNSAFELYIGNWYRELAPQELEGLDPEFRSIMDGEAKSDAILRNTEPENSHPHHKEAY